MDRKAFRSKMVAAIRESDEQFVRQAFRKHPEMLDPETGDFWLHTAVDEHLQPMIRLLAEVGCPIEAKNLLGNTALGLACAQDTPETVRTLLEIGADPNLSGSYYPLTVISLSIANRIEILELLHQFGCDLHRVYDHPLGPTTVLSWALSSDDQELTDFLQAKGCQLFDDGTGPGDRSETFADRKSGEVAKGKWGAAVLRSFGAGGDVESAEECGFGAPATPDEIAKLEQFFGVKIPSSLKELLQEFNGIRVGVETRRESWFLTIDEMKSAVRFYDDRDSDLVLKLFPKVMWVCQRNGMAELWGVVVKAFKPFKRGDIVAFEHDRIDDAESAGELFTQPYASFQEFVEANRKTYE